TSRISSYLPCYVCHRDLYSFPTRRSSDLLMEARIPLPDLTLAREMQAIRDIAHDVDGKATVELADGRRLTGAEIQQAYLDAVRADRKSTRLNSSHVKISYAVFCLKKKNNI